MEKIIYKGQSLPSLKELHRTHAAKGVSYASFYARHKAGRTLEEALNEPQQKREFRSFCVDGVTYPNLTVLAIAAKLTYVSAVKRCHRGWSDQEIFHGRQKPVKPEKIKTPSGNLVMVVGISYENIGHAHKCLKPSATLITVKARLRYGWTLEQALEVEKKVDGRKLRQDWTHGPHEKKEYTAFGVTYATVANLARAHSLDYYLVNNRLRNGWPAERAVSEPASVAVQVKGVRYKSAMNAWTLVGKTSIFVYNSRRQAGHDLETCLGLKPLKEHNLALNGTTYASLADVAAAVGIKESLLASRMTRMSLEKAISYNPSNGRYTIKRFKQDDKLAKSIGFLYFVKIAFSDGPLHKIGITQRTVESRFAGDPNFTCIAVIKGQLIDLFNIEQAIIKAFRYLHYRADDEFEGRTETFMLTDKEEQLVFDAITSKVTQLGADRAKFIVSSPQNSVVRG